MLISKKWLQEFVKIPAGLTDQELANRISLSTVEVERVDDQAVNMHHMVVGVIESVEKHPNADRLRVCQVNVGISLAQIVCGGTNVAVGMKVAVALPGSWVRWHGEGELVEIKHTKLRGEPSEGMICASSEIGLPQTEGDGEILDLSHLDVPAGIVLAEALEMNDVIFDIEHKSLTNRPDLMGHYGMAREISALTKASLNVYKPKTIAPGKGMTLNVSVENTDLCPRYMAVAMEGIHVEASPRWLQRRLEACGVRSINNVVDVSNFVMLELGQPMHAFDADVLGDQIVVRLAKPHEKMTALDEKTYQLDSDMLVIANGEKPMAIAGVMGGEGSGVSDKTTRIVFESANFSPVSVRKTSTKLALRSESSARFEKSLDPTVCELALRRAVELLSELSPGARVASKVVDVYARPPKPVTVSFSVSLVNERLGTQIPAKIMEEILTQLGFKVRIKKDVFDVTIPSWRATKDVEIVEDVIEEIARLYGYDNIVSTLPSFTITPPYVDRVRVLERSAREVLVGAGATETYQYAFVRPQTLELLGESLDAHLKLANPLAEDRPYLVRSLVPNLLETVIKNQRLFDSVRLFQSERVFRKEENGEEMGEGSDLLPLQPRLITGVYSGKGNDQPFWEAKKMLDQIMKKLGFAYVLAPSEQPESWQHPVRQARVLVDGVVVGTIAEVDPQKAEALGLDHRVSVFELNLNAFADLPEPLVQYEPVMVHPASERDLAFVVDERVAYGAIEEKVQGHSPFLKQIELFDVYRGKGVEEGKKSLAVHFIFRSADRTLESKEVDAEIQKIRQVLETEFGATIRT
ncbi:phenylalanine--tRNA ligase subunit beta [Candidatus Uhrbacteria bacterium CG10_big_fil_rev_8_21_14_0_10_48_16]|uniref:Phenylalanine--tRNA ligase beta subunit n=1 Tax=Candidatus Uhrbacteria bacterium CG10_big_fil_rev_8_21_14_0_10_48_16 TaxID=1975038 RepID=A0A2M8LIE0_9BACT|nr:MAG: phenylalanine--tRNA ligase subunit beta [Candidatus Uhrbacteria bacterium CG10_big_fil_rev_8_21_14_0_10_48_16]